MLLQDLINAVVAKRKGAFTKVMYKSEKVVNGITYTKFSNMVVRFGINYANIKGVIVKGYKNPNETTINDYGIKYNANTNNTCIKAYTTNNPKHKSKSVYYANGNEISKSEYENAIKPRTSNATVVLNLNIDNIIKIG